MSNQRPPNESIPEASIATQTEQNVPVTNTPPSPPQPTVAGLKYVREHSFPFLVLSLVALLVCLTAHYSSINVNWATTKDFTDAFRNVTQGLAFIAGGIWAYFKFVKGRTFQESLTPVVLGKFVSVREEVFLIVTVQIKNAGLSKVNV